jgi:hypothetical protein
LSLDNRWKKEEAKAAKDFFQPDAALRRIPPSLQESEIHRSPNPARDVS